MGLVGVLDVGAWVMPLVFGTGIPVCERMLLWRGRDGLSRYIAHDGYMAEKALVALADEWKRPLAIRIVRQLGRDLRGGASLLVITFIACTIAAAVLGNRPTQMWIGIGLACGYAYMFGTTVQHHRKLGSMTTFDASLVQLKRPVFLSYSIAELTTTEGKSFNAGVHWRTVEALRRRSESFVLVFVGEPGKATFMGFRVVHVPSEGAGVVP